MLSKITGIQRQVIISSCLYPGQALIGYTTSWTGSVIPKLRDLEQSPVPYLLTESQLALTASVLHLGAFGVYIVLWLSNIIGRKPCLILSTIVTGIAYVILAMARSTVLLYIGRILVGAGIGSIAVANLMYIGEIASPNIRGILLTTLGVFTTLGSILSFATGPYISYHGTTYIPIALSIAIIICLSFIPETPIFYAIQGRNEDLRRVLQDLDRLEDMNELLETKHEHTSVNTKKEWIELFSIRTNRKALFIVVVINILQHCSGVLAIAFFSAEIFNMAGSSIKWNIAMVIIGCTQLSGSTVTPCFIESAGRKIILIISSAICSLSMFILGLYFYLDHIGSDVISHIKWLPVVVLILFHIGYDSGIGIIPNAIIGEMFTSNVRSKGSTVAMTTSWLFGFLVTTAFGALLETIGGHVAFWFFSCTCACAVLFTVFFVPETKGKTLLEIQNAL